MRQEVEKDVQDRLPPRSAWSGLAVVYACFVSFGAVFQFVPPLLPGLIRGLGLAHGEAGLLMSVFALPGIALSVPAGQLVDRYGARAVGGTGLALMALGTLAMSRAVEFAPLLAARTLAGAGGMVAVVALQRTVTRLFAGRPLGLPMGLATTAIPLGIVMALNLSGPLAVRHGWPTVATATGTLALVATAVFFAMTTVLHRYLGGLPRRRDAAPDAGARGWLGVPAGLWLVGGVWLCANGAMTSFVTFAPDYLRDVGLSTARRGLLTSLPMVASALLGPLVGWTVDRRGGRAVFMATGMTMAAALLVATPTGWLVPLLIVVGLGVAMSGVVTPILSSPAELLPSHRHGRAFGVLSALANIGVFTAPPLIGHVRTVTAGYLWSFQAMALLAAAGAVLALLLQRTLRPHRAAAL
jgi:ACS family glucarate transporter-like MFS transporter